MLNDITTDAFEQHFVPYNKRKAKKDYDNKWKVKKRKEVSSHEKEALSRELFQQLGGKLRCDEYDSEMGVYQIAELDYLHSTQSIKSRKMFLALKNCFRELF